MYLNRTIEELHELLVAKEVTPLQLAKEAIAFAKEKESERIFEYVCEAEALAFAATLQEPEPENVFWGIPYVAKDNFSTKGIPTTGSSDILKDYVPVFDATVIRKLKEAKAILIGKTTLDELAMGGTGMTGHLGWTFNPYDPSHTYMVGGSSCGSAAAMAWGMVPFALGSDTGDSIRKPASYAGLVGLKPTWGRISRYGLFPFAPSLDHVGFFTRSVRDAAYALSLLAGRDEADATSSTVPAERYEKCITGTIQGKKIAVFRQVIDNVASSLVRETFLRTCDTLRLLGATVDVIDVDIRLLKAIFPTYFVISCAEATSNNSNLDGIKFGPRIGGESSYQEVMIKARTAGFGEQIKRRFVLGSYSLFKENQSELFLKAQKARRLIVDTVNQILGTYDAIYLPCVSNAKNPFDPKEENDPLSDSNLIVENHMAIGNFAGLPSLSLPIGTTDDGFPFAGNFTCRAFHEGDLLNIAAALEEKTGLRNMTAGSKEVSK